MLLLSAVAAPAAAQGIEIRSGQTARGEIREPGEVHLYRFEAAEGDSLTVQLRSGKYGPLTGVLRLFAPRRELFLPLPFYGVVSGSDIVLPATGIYYLSVTGRDLTRGPYELRLRVRPQKLPPLVLPLPGEVGVNAAAGSVLSARTTLEPGAATVPILELVENAAGQDILAVGRLKNGPRGPAVSGLPVDVSGRCRFVFDASGPAGGLGALRVAVRLLTPREKRLAQSLLPAAFLAKVRYPVDDGSWSLRLEAAVVGSEVDSALVAPWAGGPGAALAPVAGYLSLAEALDPVLEPTGGDWPDGFYDFRVRDRDGSQREFPMRIQGTWPTALSILGVGKEADPLVTWGPTGPAGEAAQIILVRVTDRISGAVFYETAAAGTATSQAIPGDVLPVGWPYRIEARAMSAGRKVTVGGLDVAGAQTIYGISWPDDDRHSLVADLVDPVAMRYELRTTRGVTVTTDSTGTLSPLPGAGRFAFEATDDDSGSGIPPFPVLFAPGRFVVGRTPADSLFAGPVRVDTSYVATEIAGLWNYVGTESGIPRYGTIRIGVDNSYQVWEGGDGSLDPDFEGVWLEQGGTVRLTIGASTYGTATFLPSTTGRGLLVLDRPDGSILLGARRQPAAAGEYDGAYDLLSSAAGGVTAWSLSGGALLPPGEGPVPVEFGLPHEGLLSSGSLDTGGLLGLAAPEGTLFLLTFGPGGSGARLLAGVRR